MKLGDRVKFVGVESPEMVIIGIVGGEFPAFRVCQVDAIGQQNWLPSDVIELVNLVPDQTRRHPEPSWSPDLITTNLSFGQALVAMKAGKKVRRDIGSNIRFFIQEGVLMNETNHMCGPSMPLTNESVLANDWAVVE